MKKKTERGKKLSWLREKAPPGKRVKALLTNLVRPGISLFFFGLNKRYRDTELFDHPLGVLQMSVNEVHFKARVKVHFR